MSILPPMQLSATRCLSSAVTLCLLSVAAVTPALAEGMNCLINRGNLCFSTGCDNSGKSQRIVLNFAEGSMRVCPNRFNDTGCADVPVEFEIRDNAIVGTTLKGPELAARSVFVNRVTGAFTSMRVTAGGVASVDFGACELRR